MVQNRAVLGSAESRRLRRQGLIPGVLYGRERPVAITIGERELRAALTGESGANAVLDVVVEDGAVHASVLKDYQRDAVRGSITHVDLQEVRLDQPIHATVPVQVTGEPAGAKLGGVFTQAVMEINVEALPLEVPASVEFDASELGLGESVQLGQIELPAGVTLLDDPETTLASVAHQSRAEEVETEAVEGEGPAGEGGEAGPSDEAESASDDETSSEE